MADLPTRTDLFDAGAREMIARSEQRAPGKRVSPQALYTPGTDVNILVAGGSAMAEEVLRQHARDTADLYLDSATLAGLERLLPDRYSRSLTRKRASAALVVSQLQRSAGTFPAVNYSAGDRARTATGVEFEFLSAVSLAALATGPVTATMRAVLAGTQGNVGVDQVTQLVNPIDENMRITNPTVGAGGSDDETASSYRERGRLFFLAAPKGTGPAILFGTLSVPGVALATVEEQVDENGDPTGFVFIYIADVNGQANQALVELVKIGLREFRCCGIPPFVIGAIPEYVPITYRLRFTAGTDPQLAFDQLRFATVALVAQTNPGKPLERSLLYAIARRVPGLVVLEDTVANPLGDVYPSAPNRALRTTLDRVTQVPA